MVFLWYKWLLILGFSFIPGKESNIGGVDQDRPVHPFYLSVTEVNHNPSAKTLEISCKMFADDLEAIIEKNYKTTLDITTEKDKGSFDRYIPDYVAKKLSITVDGKPVRLNYIGFEAEKESAYVYMEVQGVSSIKKIDIDNSLLYDFTNEQINIIHVVFNDNRKSTKLLSPHSQASFSF